MNQLEQLDHSDIGFLPVTFNCGDNFSGALFRLHLRAASRCCHRRFDHRRQCLDDVQACSAQLKANGLGKAAQARFGCAIDWPASAWCNGKAGCDVDKRCFRPCLELRHKQCRQMDRSIKVEEDRPVDGIKVNRFGKIIIDASPCIIDQNVERARRCRGWRRL